MHISEEHIQRYREDGYLLIPNAFSYEDVAVLQAELPAIFQEESPRRVIEKKRQVVRSVYGLHTTNQLFAGLIRHPLLVGPARQILKSHVYVHQSKINVKAAFVGDVWEWHQDYIFWKKEDGIRENRLVNAAIFLDEVTEFNGPLIFIPGSHQDGSIDVSANQVSLQEAQQIYAKSPAWIANLTADLKYTLGQEKVAHLVRRNGLVAPKGPAGTLLFFDGNICHSSATNISPFDRNVVLITYNSVENIPATVASHRPDFLAGRDYQPIEPLSAGISLKQLALAKNC
jgi:ectoine hydroxylase